jgi:1-acyl-sn-glycerol-3-phosphate acyltransferase
MERPPPSREAPVAPAWQRRLVTIPGVFLGLALVTAALPGLLLGALLVDVLRPAGRRSLASPRLVLFLAAYLFTEVVGLTLLAGLGLATLGSAARRAALTWRVQRLYTAMHMGAVRGIFALTFEVEGAELAAGGPVVVLVRHASIIDALLPGVFIANRHGIELRYVLKRELLVDPCLDVAGHWLPNHFVARDGLDSQREIEAVRALKAGIGPSGGVLIYPEGTRFTEAGRRRLLDRLGGDPPALARAERLRHLMPIRPGGTLALLGAAPRCDVLFVGHTGLEGFSSIRDIWAGALVGKTVRLKLWREPAASVPVERAEQLLWLDARWERLDAWLEARIGEEPLLAPGATPAAAG